MSKPATEISTAEECANILPDVDFFCFDDALVKVMVLQLELGRQFATEDNMLAFSLFRKTHVVGIAKFADGYVCLGWSFKQHSLMEISLLMAQYAVEGKFNPKQAKIVDMSTICSN